MAPKSTKSKKQSLALVLSTPTMARGQKRKSKDYYSKDKGKNKKGESTSVLALERNVPYFDEDKSQERYNIDFSIHKVTNGRCVDYIL